MSINQKVGEHQSAVSGNLHEQSGNLDSARLANGIDDNAKRSVSIRINTSDYGKIKTIARKLRVKESGVFRYLMRRSLRAVEPLYRNDASCREVLEVFAEDGGELISHFDFGAEKIKTIFEQYGANDNEQLQDEDVELLTMVSMPEKYLALLLSEVTGQKVEPRDNAKILERYFDDKYGAG